MRTIKKTIKDKMQIFYDGSAPTFDMEQEEFSFVRFPEKQIVQKVFTAILQPKQTVLEIGAGTGRFTLLSAPRVKHVTAVDISQNMLQQLAAKMEKEQLKNISLIHGDFMGIDFSERFDVIISFSAIEYIKDKEALFKKMANLLKPGGKLVLTTPHDTFFRWWGRLGNYFRQKIFMAAYSKKRMARLLAKNGLTVVEMHDLSLKTILNKGVLLFVHAAK
jgi:ubiquinone/menaquinone biosynthesis C-methylase UbiE